MFVMEDMSKFESRLSADPGDRCDVPYAALVRRVSTNSDTDALVDSLCRSGDGGTRTASCCRSLRLAGSNLGGPCYENATGCDPHVSRCADESMRQIFGIIYSDRTRMIRGMTRPA
uniref:Uncharacterized protein n=1 Tax=Pseudomonas phage PACT201 TaxID=3230130 RepID=A0AAU8GS73_9VIRU